LRELKELDDKLRKIEEIAREYKTEISELTKDMQDMIEPIIRGKDRKIWNQVYNIGDKFVKIDARLDIERETVKYKEVLSIAEKFIRKYESIFMEETQKSYDDILASFTTISKTAISFKVDVRENLKVTSNNFERRMLNESIKDKVIKMYDRLKAKVKPYLDKLKDALRITSKSKSKAEQGIEMLNSLYEEMMMHVEGKKRIYPR
jgi:uncharacterized protein YlxW (UPF0749 family)